jgi:hypothetical protein
MTRILLSLIVVLCFLNPPSLGEPNIQRFFPNFPGYRFVMLNEVTDLKESERLGPFGVPVLEEAGLESHSIWNIRNASGITFNVEILETADSSGAFELFSLWTEVNPVGELERLDLPISNLFGKSGAVFWRGNYFIEVRQEAVSELSRTAFSNLVSDFVKNTPLENMLPVSVTHIPEQDLVADSVRFYLGAQSLSLNDRFPEPLLEEIGFTDRIEIAFGRYLPGDHSLFLIGYPTPTLAEDYFVKLQDRLQGFFSDEGIYMKRAGVIICLFIGPEESARTILPRVEYAPTIKWLYEKKPDRDSSETRTFLGLIASAILGSGVFMLLIIGSGLVVGLARYEVLRRFPGISKRKQMIRLNLK